MTREEAIRIITGAGVSPRLYKDRTEANAAILVDTLSALGVLKLEEREVSAPSEPIPCEPPLEHRAKNWHWLYNQDAWKQLQVFQWFPKDQVWEWNGAPQYLSEKGWRYIAPCEEPKL